MQKNMACSARVSILAILLMLSGCEQKTEAQKQAKQIQKEQQASSPNFEELSTSLAGNYLAGRFAVGSDDLTTANKFYQRALDAADEEKPYLVERALPAAMGAGDMDEALKLAKDIDLDKPLATSQLAVTLLLTDAFKDNDLKHVQELLPKLKADGFGRLLKPLMEVWTQVGLKDNAKAMEQLNQFGKTYPSLNSLTELHTAFIYDLQDKKDEAAKAYTQALDHNLSVRSAWIVGEFYERNNDPDRAVALYNDLGTKMQGSPFAQLVIQRMKDGKLHHERFIQAPKDGVAAALYDVATVLHQESSSRLAILYAQMAYYLTPKDPFVNLLLGDIIATADVPDKAADFYKSIGKDSDLYILAQFRLAQFFEEKGENNKAVGILEDLSKDKLVSRQAWTEIGDIYRRQETFDKAIPFYTKAIEASEKPQPGDWALFYARGICYERAKDWDKAEADLLQALKLNPDQPEVLNYLAYSWADSGKNLEKALQMLQSALAAAPDDPYITDSVGWALYKNGRYEDAVPYLEAAIQQLPDDPTINDHLGDIYAHVGRPLEANFQWQRALKHVGEHDADLKKEIEAKLKDSPVKTSDASPPVASSKE
jgi:tetratricopeptide (TPR) repeat protein